MYIKYSSSIVLDETTYPFVAFLIADKDNEFICGGAIASAFFVLTTAECLIEKWSNSVELLSIYRYYVGAGDNTVAKDNPGNTQERRIELFIIHPDFTRKSEMHNIGLIKLRRPFDLGTRMASAAMLPSYLCEGPDPIWEMYPTCILVDWGSEGISDSRPLRHRIVPLLNLSVCEAMHKNLDLALDENFHICTRDPMLVEASCSTDGGSLLLCGPRDRFRLHGLMHRRGSGCGPYPDPEIYTKILPYRPWLDETVEKVYKGSVQKFHQTRSALNRGSRLCEMVE
ncbi:neurotrypsin-like [Ctenocephalides felis]|uniref:neurotrypsin-like n=1 Tax=Ctenocephalides felis TaxID=7515 RepID=UPI000E6E5517|nr:neurotrypsin-like [Ctenocephalides felis]